MFCPKCGNQLPDGSAFCGKCGAKLENGVCPHCSALKDSAPADSTPPQE